ncbi:MAG TPA: O-antigen ligase family protein, partial [Solirubrobacteraceae bacterium]
MAQSIELPADAAAPDPADPEQAGPRAPSRAAQLLDQAGALVPAALLLYFAFNAGGFFPGATGLAAGALAVLLALRTTLALRPFASLSGPIAVAAAALAALAVWTLVSVAWSDAPGRALLEFNRTLLYLFAFVFCATLPFTRRRLVLAVRGLVLAIFVACAAGWASRVLPDLIAPRPGASASRLGYPVTYWNGQGLLATLGALFALHLACSLREPRVIRALGAAAVPLIASTLFFTFSRGAILALAVGLVAYLLLYRERGLLSGALAVVPTTAAALLISYDADVLARSGRRLAPEAIAQGHDVAVGVAFCTAIAFFLRLGLALWADAPLRRIALPERARRPVKGAALAAALVAVVAVPLALGAPGYAQRQWDRFTTKEFIVEKDQRDRLLDPANNGRLSNWEVARDAFERKPWTGTGAGTYVHEWYEHRDIDLKLSDGHSLYLETLSDLGLVGFAALLVALGVIVGTAVARRDVKRRSRGRDRSLDAVIGAAMLAWAVHAGIDWMWELPAVTAWVFALGGLALARRVAPGGPPAPGRSVRVAIGLGCLVLAVAPLQVARSQSALDRAARAFTARPQNCPAVIDASLGSLAAVGARAEPWELIAFCDVGQNEPVLARRA